MAKVAVKVEDYLADLGFTADEVKELAPKFASRAEKLSEGFMRQSDYDRVMNEGKADLAKAQSDLAAANDRLNVEMAEWAQLQNSGKQMTEKMRSDLEAAQLRVTQLTQRVTRVATDAGMDPAKALEGIEQMPPPSKTVEAPDMTGYVKTADFQQGQAALANMALTLPAELYALATEHQKLFNETLDAREIVKELQSRASNKHNQKSLNPREIWEEQYKVVDKRADVAKAKYDADIAAAREEGRVSAMSEAALPGSTNAPGVHAPVFGDKGRTSVLSRPQPGGTVQTAAAAFRTGKYRQGKSGAGRT